MRNHQVFELINNADNTNSDIKSINEILTFINTYPYKKLDSFNQVLVSRPETLSQINDANHYISLRNDIEKRGELVAMLLQPHYQDRLQLALQKWLSAAPQFNKLDEEYFENVKKEKLAALQNLFNEFGTYGRFAHYSAQELVAVAKMIDTLISVMQTKLSDPAIVSKQKELLAARKEIVKCMEYHLLRGQNLPELKESKELDDSLMGSLIEMATNEIKTSTLTVSHLGEFVNVDKEKLLKENNDILLPIREQINDIFEDGKLDTLPSIWLDTTLLSNMPQLPWEEKLTDNRKVYVYFKEYIQVFLQEEENEQKLNEQKQVEEKVDEGIYSKAAERIYGTISSVANMSSALLKWVMPSDNVMQALQSVVSPLEKTLKGVADTLENPISIIQDGLEEVKDLALSVYERYFNPIEARIAKYDLVAAEIEKNLERHKEAKATKHVLKEEVPEVDELPNEDKASMSQARNLVDDFYVIGEEVLDGTQKRTLPDETPDCFMNKILKSQNLQAFLKIIDTEILDKYQNDPDLEIFNKSFMNDVNKFLRENSQKIIEKDLFVQDLSNAIRDLTEEKLLGINPYLEENQKLSKERKYFSVEERQKLISSDLKQALNVSGSFTEKNLDKLIFRLYKYHKEMVKKSGYLEQRIDKNEKELNRLTHRIALYEDELNKNESMQPKLKLQLAQEEKKVIEERLENDMKAREKLNDQIALVQFYNDLFTEKYSTIAGIKKDEIESLKEAWCKWDNEQENQEQPIEVQRYSKYTTMVLKKPIENYFDNVMQLYVFRRLEKLKAELLEGKQLLQNKLAELENSPKKESFRPEIALLKNTISDGFIIDNLGNAVSFQKIIEELNLELIPPLHKSFNDIKNMPEKSISALELDEAKTHLKSVEQNIYRQLKHINNSIYERLEGIDQTRSFVVRFKEWLNDLTRKIFGVGQLSTKATFFKSCDNQFLNEVRKKQDADRLKAEMKAKKFETWHARLM